MKEFSPRSLEEFSGEANCMLFAYDLEKTPGTKAYDYNLWGFRSAPIKQIVEQSAKKMGIILRKISSKEECPEGKYLIAFFLIPPTDEYGDFDYHFIRRNLDGIWVEKPNWDTPPQEANFEELVQYLGIPTYFVIEGVL